jgi:hypothetical protein
MAMNGRSSGACSMISAVSSPVATVPTAMYPDSRASARTICHGDTLLITPRICARQHRFTVVKAIAPAAVPSSTPTVITPGVPPTRCTMMISADVAAT